MPTSMPTPTQAHQLGAHAAVAPAAAERARAGDALPVARRRTRLQPVAVGIRGRAAPHRCTRLRHRRLLEARRAEKKRKTKTSPTRGGPEAVWLPPCTLEEQPAATSRSGRSSVEAGYAASTADSQHSHKHSLQTLTHDPAPPLAFGQKASESSPASRASPASWLPTRSLISGTSRTPPPWAYAVRAACWPPCSSNEACRATPRARPCATLSVLPSSLWRRATRRRGKSRPSMGLARLQTRPRRARAQPPRKH